MRSKTNRAIVAMAALALVVAACGDDEDDAASPEVTTAGTEAGFDTSSASTEARQ